MKNIMRDLRLANLRKTNKYLVASEVLTDTLAKQGYDTKFLPPMFTEKLGRLRKIGPVLDYCLVGHMGEGKNVELAIEAFIELYKTWLQGPDYLLWWHRGTSRRATQSLRPATNHSL